MAVLWLWSLLLQFNLMNQTVSLEDTENKPWRPVPSGRISLHNARIARWIIIPACIIISWVCGGAPVLAPCVVFICGGMPYNFHGADKNGFVKNLMNGLGLSTLALGTALVASKYTPFLS